MPSHMLHVHRHCACGLSVPATEYLDIDSSVTMAAPGGLHSDFWHTVVYSLHVSLHEPGAAFNKNMGPTLIIICNRTLRSTSGHV